MQPIGLLPFATITVLLITGCGNQNDLDAQAGSSESSAAIAAVATGAAPTAKIKAEY